MPGPQNMENTWPQDVGIIAMEIYFPSQYVDQAELEAFDGVSQGKYTIGLGQSKMGFCSDREDINSLCMTAVQSLMEKYNVAYEDIGYLEVGTETVIDKSKSVKTVLMQLFESEGNTNIEGIDTTNACYGGTQALFHATHWVESSYWDGRYALVVAGDIAVYASGNARCTGGAGAVAMLVGPNAPLIFDRGLRGTHMQHVYDFYKPDMASEYPVVDGKLSIQCYLNALDKCYKAYIERYRAKMSKEGQPVSSSLLETANAFCFHSPYCRLVQKSLGRLMLNDFLQDPSPDMTEKYAGLEEFRDLKLEDTFFNRDVEKAFLTASKMVFEEKTRPTLAVANLVGNMYTPSLYGGLVSYLSSRVTSELKGTRVVLFSYGSGLASSMFSLTISQDASPGSPLDAITRNLSNLRLRLDSRIKVDPPIFDKTMKLREETHHLAPYTPVGAVTDLFPGSWFLTSIDDKHRRKYERKPVSHTDSGPGSPVADVNMTDLTKKMHRTNSSEGNALTVQQI